MYQFFSLLTRPSCFLFLLLGAALAALWWRRQEKRRRLVWATAFYVLLAVLATPAAGHLALGTLEWSYPAGGELPADAEAIVVLSGYVRPQDGVRPRPELGTDTLYRCLHGLTLSRSNRHLPIVVSGGIPPGVPTQVPFADTMRAFFVEMGVPPEQVWPEARSTTTHENAVETAELLHTRGIRRIVLVTDAEHMRRAAGCFRKQGLEVTPSACNHVATQFHWQLRDFLPCSEGLAMAERTTHEWLGLGYYWLRGRL